MKQSSILSAKFDCPVACHNLSLLATTHDCETVKTIIQNNWQPYNESECVVYIPIKEDSCSEKSLSFEY